MNHSAQFIRTTGVGLAVIALAACGSGRITPAATSAGSGTSMPVATPASTADAGASSTVTTTSTVTSTVSRTASPTVSRPAASATTLTPTPSAPHTFVTTHSPSASASRTPSASASAGGLPVLGLASAFPASVVGIGKVRPNKINLGGDGTSYIENVEWSTWGGRHADGYGTANWVPENAANADSVPVRAHVRAYDLGTCGGRPAYRRLVWWWPSKGGTFAKAVAEGDGYHVCTGY